MENNVAIDSFGRALKVGDYVCFTVSMRRDQKPIVRARIGEITPCTFDKIPTAWLTFDELTESPEMQWALRENRLPSKILCKRVVKCY